MNPPRVRWLLALLILTALPLAGRGEDLHTVIDRLLAERWAAAQAVPAPPAEDAEFLRRVYLDLTGTLPAVGKTREFLRDPRPDKRQRLIESLLKSSAHIEHSARIWRDTLLPDRNDPQSRAFRDSFETWLQVRLRENTGYDRLVREILTVKPAGGDRRRGIDLGMDVPDGTSPLAFYAANEYKPENLAGSTARLFLAVKLECAQCHNHPFAKWSREQFWQYAAFFGAVDARGKPRPIKIPGLDLSVTARYLDGTEPVGADRTDPRTQLANWITRADNPYFARAVVNRLWAQLMGTGLVEPIDDLTREDEKDPLLDELARQFVEHGYDLKFLIRGIVTSRAYGLTSRLTHPSQEAPRLFAHMAVRGLAPEQVFDSLVEATHYENVSPQSREEFLTRFAHATERPTETQTSILQALALMNGPLVADATSLERSATLGAVDAPFFSTGERLEALFLAALCRMPTAEERARLERYVEEGGPSHDPKQALADVFWALLNSSEFLFNH